MPVAFDTTGMERHDERTWFDPRTGDQVSLTYIGLVPDIPAPLDDLPLLRRRLAEETAETGSIIEAHVVSLDGEPTLFQLIKLPIPGQDTGLAFIAAFTVPRDRCSAVLRVQCAEVHMTGQRESTVAAQVGFENCFPPHPYAPDVHGQLPYNVADEAMWDPQFPDHPLTRARVWAQRTLATARLDPRFKALPAFQVPAMPEPEARHASPAEPLPTPAPEASPHEPAATDIEPPLPHAATFEPAAPTYEPPSDVELATPAHETRPPAHAAPPRPTSHETPAHDAPNDFELATPAHQAQPPAHTAPPSDLSASREAPAHAGPSQPSPYFEPAAPAYEPPADFELATPAYDMRPPVPATDFAAPHEPPDPIEPTAPAPQPLPARPSPRSRADFAEPYESRFAHHEPTAPPLPEPAHSTPSDFELAAPALPAPPPRLAEPPRPTPNLAEPPPGAHAAPSDVEPPAPQAPRPHLAQPSTNLAEPPPGTHAAPATPPGTYEPPPPAPTEPTTAHTPPTDFELPAPASQALPPFVVPPPGTHAAPATPPGTYESSTSARAEPTTTHTTPSDLERPAPQPHLAAQPQPTPNLTEPPPAAHAAPATPPSIFEPPATAPAEPTTAHTPPTDFELPAPQGPQPQLAQPSTNLAAPPPGAHAAPASPPHTFEPSTSAPTEPNTVEPANTAPAVAEPAAAEPTAAEPAVAQPTTAQPTTAQPAVAESPVPFTSSADPASAPPAEPEPASRAEEQPPVEVGDMLQTVLVGLPLAGYLPLWLESGVTFWRMKDPDAVRARLGAGLETRSEIDTHRYREAAMFSPSRGTLFLMDRFRDESGHLGGTSTQLEPATEDEAYAAVDDKAISELYVWLGEVVLESVRRGEFVAVETGGWEVPMRPVVLMMLRTDGREWHSVVETSPVPVGAPVWRDQQPVDGTTQVLASPATDQTVRASGLLTRFAVATWGMHPFQLGLSFGPNPTL
ncbi:hypothetical protein [Actinophytocola sp.]|uniref:hypothetical protein n=1 Tax=Actinophytocola sp. TaxID=1872138 RepID=UPI002ED112EF